MKALPRAFLLGGAAAILASALYLGCGGEPAAAGGGEGRDPRGDATSPASERSAPLKNEPPTRYHDGASWATAVWAADEIQLVLAPGADPAKALPDQGVFTRNGGEAGLRIVPAADRAAFAARAKDWEGRPGVREARPVFYATPEALEKRSIPQRLVLTRQVAVTLPEGASAEALAARHGARVLSKLGFMERTWLLEAPGFFGALDLADALREREGLAFAAPQFARVRDKKRPRRLIPNDPLFASQWHLRNTGQGGGTAGEDVNAAAAWDVVRGAGVVIGVVDDGLERTHEDLQPNYSSALSFDFNDGDADPSPTSLDDHGTPCAGLAGARQNNSLGLSGVAPEATLAGLRLTAGGVSDADEAQAMSHQNAAIHVKTNSWGPPDNGFTLERPGPLMAAALQDGATNGRGGRGVVYTWAGGNGLGPPFNDNSNFDGYANNRHVIGVGAVDNRGRQTTYSERGANLLVCAPGGQSDIWTTALLGVDYTGSFSGTSAATPIVAGAAALMLSRNPNLKARDVMHVLARRARQNDALDSDWTTNAAGFPVNHKYGFGVVDAAAAVDLSGRWPYVGPVESRSATSGALSLALPDNDPLNPVTHALAINGTPFRIEHVEVDFSATHPYRGDIVVTLVAPSGTRSRLAEPRNGDSGDDYAAWTFLSRRHWGEMAVGTWTLEVADGLPADTGTFTGWTLRVYGTPVDTTAPAAGTVNDGAAADVDAQPSLTTVTANWTGFSDPQSGIVYEWAIGTSPLGTQVRPYTEVGYDTIATATGLSLSDGVTYYVSVRATNFEGLSTEVSSDGFAADSLPPAAPAAPTATPAFSTSGAFSLAWAAPADPGGSGVGAYTIERSKNGGAFSQVAAGVALTTFQDDASPAGEGSYTYRVRAVDAAGNAGPFSAPSTAVVLDATPPLAAITSPTSGGTHTTSASPLALGGTATDAVGVVALSWVNAALAQGGSATGTVSWSASVPLVPGENRITVYAWDAAGNVGADVLTVTYAPSDLLPPSVTIGTPTAADTLSTGTTPLGLAGGAFDDTGVTVVEWENRTTGTRGLASGTSFWTASVPLLSGANVLVVTARDAAGHATSDVLTVAFSPPADATLPAVSITSPTSSPTLATGVSPPALGGTASDDTALAYVRWTNAATGGGSTASGLANWTAGPALAPGTNVLTVTAVDAAGNEASDVLTVTFTPPGGDAVAPFIEILSPASGPTFSTSLGEVLLAGHASDDVGALEVVWSNAATGASGTAKGVGTWSAEVALISGANAITVRVFDAAGNSRTDLLTVTFTPPSSGGGGGGGGGCGATGWEALAVAALALAGRRFRRA